jgi:hypothetical protein
MSRKTQEIEAKARKGKSRNVISASSFSSRFEFSFCEKTGNKSICW